MQFTIFQNRKWDFPYELPLVLEQSAVPLITKTKVEVY